MASVDDSERRSGQGRRFSDQCPANSRIERLEQFIEHQFTPGQSVHASDHERIRESERDHRRVRLSVAERGLWAALCFFAVAAWEALRRTP